MREKQIEEFISAPGSLPATGLSAGADPKGRSVRRAAAYAGLLQCWGSVTHQLVLLKGVGAALAPHQCCLQSRSGARLMLEWGYL